MAYLKEFKQKIENNDLQKILVLWEEYTNNDQVDLEELCQILELFKTSDMAPTFGKYVDMALQLWKIVESEADSYRLLRLILDLQTTNNPLLGQLAYQALEKKFGKDPQFNQRIRLVGLRTQELFQGALSNYELLHHMAKGKFVYHIGGWGTGEIVDISPIREQITLEFENVTGRRDMTYSNAFKMLVPLADDHFLARRFGNPNALEALARKDSLEVMHLLLRDLGPLSATEIKDHMADLVIPEAEWSKWWQSARAKIKKDTLIETPKTLKGVFALRNQALSHEDQMQQEIHGQSDLREILITTYNYVRDFPNMLKKEEVKQSVIDKLNQLFSIPDMTPTHEIQIAIFLETLLKVKNEDHPLKELITRSKDIVSIINEMEILAFKKQAMLALRKDRADWIEIFTRLLFSLEQTALRDYIFNEFNQPPHSDHLFSLLENLQQNPQEAPDVFVWYFQKILSKEKNIPFSDIEGRRLFLESLLVLLHKLEQGQETQYRELIKKIYSLLTAKRYEVVRNIIEGASLEYIKEFLLLASKCRTLGSHDVKSLRALAKVVQPSIESEEERNEKEVEEDLTLWTTEEGYRKTYERLEYLTTVETLKVAQEISVAKEHGDLRENAEYKVALQKRSMIQGEIKMLSDQISRAKIIPVEEIDTQAISLGTTVTLTKDGEEVIYTILGPWEANIDQNILSYKSKLAEQMMGHKVKESFEFKEQNYTVEKIESYLKSK